MTNNAADNIVAWLDESKGALKPGQTEELTIEFTQDLGALSVQDFTTTGGVLAILRAPALSAH